MSIQSEINRIKNDKETLITNLEAIGIVIEDGAKLSEISTNVTESEALDTSDATVTADEILSGEIAYAKGNKVTGTMPNKGAVSATLNTSTTSYTVPKGYHSGSGTVKITTESKTATPTTSAQTITPTSGKVLSSVTVNAIPSIYKDVSPVTAGAGDVLTGKKIVASSGTVTGTMANNGAISTTMDGINTKSVSIPKGYTSGGTVSLDNTIDNIADTQEDLMVQIQEALADKVAPSGGTDTSDATAVAADILSGKTAYAKGNKITGTMATATQATPSISVSSGGLITASSTQSAGYVSSGTKSATKQLTTQAAKTVTPGTSNQTAVSSGIYTTGTITVKGDSNLKSENIKNGVSIFGVAGNYEGTGGGGENSVDVCTINIQSAYALNEIYASRCVQGMLLGGNVLDAPDQSTFTIPNVICGSIFFIYIAATGMSFTSATGGATIIRGAGSPLIIKAPTTAGATATVNIMSD